MVKISMIDGDAIFYYFDDLGKNSRMSYRQIIFQFNKKLREHVLKIYLIR